MPSTTPFATSLADDAYPATFTVHRRELIGDRGYGDVSFETVPECTECGDYARFESEQPYEEDAIDWAADHVVNCTGSEE